MESEKKIFYLLDNSIYFSSIINELYIELSNFFTIKKVDSINSKTKKTYIILNIKDIQEELPKKYIVYNFEQLCTETPISELFLTRLLNAKMIFDYSKLNIDFLKNKGYNNIYWFPYSWYYRMRHSCKIPKVNNRLNKILFIGSINKRRVDILRPVHHLCKINSYNMFISNSCWGSDWEDKCSISLIAINIHYSETNTILEVHRIFPYILNKIWVITERSDDKYYDDLLQNLVSFTDKDGLADTVNNICLLTDKEIEDELTKRQHLLISTIESFNNNINKFFTPILADDK